MRVFLSYEYVGMWEMERGESYAGNYYVCVGHAVVCACTIVHVVYCSGYFSRSHCDYGYIHMDIYDLTEHI